MVKLTLTNIDGNGCGCCKYSSSPAPGRWRKVVLSGVDGVYQLTQVDGIPCRYEGTFNGTYGTIEIHDAAGCGSLVETWNIKRLWFRVELYSTFGRVLIQLYAWDNSMLKETGHICSWEDFNYDSGADCAEWSPTDYTHACKTDGWCYGTNHLAAGGTIESGQVP